MRIRTQFIITMILFGMILVVIAVSAIVVHHRITTVGYQEDLAFDIAQAASTLSYLSNDYLIYRESQQLKRWQSRFASLSSQVASLNVDNREGQVLVRNVRANTQRLKEVFESVVSAVRNLSETQNVALESAFTQVSWSRMTVQSQALVSDASRLSQLLHQHREQLRNARSILMYAMVGLFGLFLFASYMLTYRRVLKSIATLQAGTTTIGSGNLDFVIKEKKNDEFGDLSHAFNQMTTSLKTVTTSKADLEREIVERKRAEEELRKQREWLRVTLSSIGDAVIATDTKGQVTFLNPVAATLIGWQFDEALSQPINSVFRIINAKTRERAVDLVSHVLSEKRVVALANDTALLTRDGREIPIEDSAAPILDANGNITGIVLVFHDVTEKRRTQTALRSAHERAAWLARFPEQNPNPVIRASSDGTVLYCNPSTTKLPGWRCKVGHLLQEELLPIVDRAIAEGMEVQADVQLDRRVYIVWVVPFPEERYVNVYSRDITERRQAEEALRNSEARYRSYIEMTEQLGWTTNARGEVVEDIPSWRKFTGQNEEQVKGWGWSRALHPDDVEHTSQVWRNAVAKRNNYEVEYRIRRYDGVYRDFLARGVPVFNDDGDVLEWVGTCIDITERKHAEKALRQHSSQLQKLAETLEQRVRERTEELEEANKALRQLSIRLLSAHEEERKRVAGEIHDTMGSCLSGIKFKVESALEEIVHTPKVATESLNAILPVIREAIEECRRIQMDLRPSMLDDLGLLPTLSWFFRRFQTIYSMIRIEQELTIEESELPDSLKTVMYRIIQEAMNNAAKHSKADLIRISLRKVDNKMELFVEDNGCGFSVQQRLFLDNSKRGLGLTSMRERTELSGGSFAVESAEGMGATVRASWPI